MKVRESIPGLSNLLTHKKLVDPFPSTTKPYNKTRYNTKLREVIENNAQKSSITNVLYCFNRYTAHVNLKERYGWAETISLQCLVILNSSHVGIWTFLFLLLRAAGVNIVVTCNC